MRCSTNSAPKPEVDVRQVINRIAPEFPTAVIDVVLDPTLSAFWVTEECKKLTSLTRRLTDPPALPLSLVSGGIQMQVPATAGAVAVDTTYASSRAAGGTTFQAGHNPTVGVSQFVCLAGTLQVQPTAAGAPPLILGPGNSSMSPPRAPALSVTFITSTCRYCDDDGGRGDASTGQSTSGGACKDTRPWEARSIQFPSRTVTL